MLLSLNPEARMHYWMLPFELPFGVMQWRIMQVAVVMQCSDEEGHADPGIGGVGHCCWRDRVVRRVRGLWVL